MKFEKKKILLIGHYRTSSQMPIKSLIQYPTLEILNRNFDGFETLKIPMQYFQGRVLNQGFDQAFDLRCGNDLLVPFLAFQGLPQISFSLDQKCLEKSSFRQLPAHEKNWIHSEIKRWFPSYLNFSVLHEIMKNPRGAAGNDNQVPPFDEKLFKK